MAQFVINGGKPLKGTVIISGSKNAALPIIAATLLTRETCYIDNVPDIADVRTLLKIMGHLGAKYIFNGHKLEISNDEIARTIPPTDLVRQLRASILLLGPMLARKGRFSMAHPGGCIIGKRPVETHFEALRLLGAKIVVKPDNYLIKTNGLKGKKIFLDEVSVTATENALMAAVLAKGETIIKPAACEPHVVDLARFLRKMGADIQGEGTHTIIVKGIGSLSGAEHSVINDEVETASFAIAAIATKGMVTITNPPWENLDSITHKLEQMGGVLKKNNDNSLTVKRGNSLRSARIQIDTWPRLPTDLQPQLAALATQCEGTSLIHDWMYEKRLSYVEELSKMGANITICDPHRALVSGPTKLYGTQIRSLDLRAGMATLIAALTADGRSVISQVELIDRGYEDIEGRLRKLGADIKRIEDKN